MITTRERFIDRMIKDPVRRGRVPTVARELEIKPSAAARCWKQYNKTGELHRKSEKKKC